MSEVQVQCYLDDSDNEIQLEYVTMSAGKFDKGIDPEQAKMMNYLVNIAVDTDQTNKLLMFPPHGDKTIK